MTDGTWKNSGGERQKKVCGVVNSCSSSVVRRWARPDRKTFNMELIRQKLGPRVVHGHEQLLAAHRARGVVTVEGDTCSGECRRGCVLRGQQLCRRGRRDGAEKINSRCFTHTRLSARGSCGGACGKLFFVVKKFGKKEVSTTKYVFPSVKFSQNHTEREYVFSRT